jgi:hypothetical protein
MNTGELHICFTHSAINVMESEDWSIHKKDTIESYASILKQGTYLYRFFMVSDDNTPTNAIFHIDTDQRVKCHSDDIFDLDRRRLGNNVGLCR